MRKTIKGKLTLSVICIVAVSIILTTVGIVAVAGRNLIQNQMESLQLNADKYAEEINTWIENEKQLANGAAKSIEAARNTDVAFIQSVMDTYAAGREELLNLYCGTKDSQFIQSNREADIPEGYDPVVRGWYQQAAEKKEVIVTDPYWDVITNQMCTTIASPVYIENELPWNAPAGYFHSFTHTSLTEKAPVWIERMAALSFQYTQDSTFPTKSSRHFLLSNVKPSIFSSCFKASYSSG